MITAGLLMIRISDAITIVVLLFMLQTFFPPKIKGWKYFVQFISTVIAGSISIYLLEYYTGSFYAYFLNFALVGILFSTLFLYGSLLSKILMTLVFCGFYLQISYIEQHIQAVLFSSAMSGHPFITQIIIYFLLLAARRMIKPNGWKLPTMHWLIIALTTIVCSVFSFYIGRMEYDISLYVGIILFGLNLLVFYFSLRLAADYEDRLQYQAINSRLKMDRKKADEIEILYNNARELRHDLYNHTLIISSLMKNKDFEGAKSYLNELNLEELKLDNGVESGHPLVNVILDQKNVQAEANGITMNIDAQIPSDLPISSTDLCALLFNLIDNSIEAGSAIKDARIDIKLNIVKNYFSIMISNSVSHKISGNYPNIATTKSDGEIHGVGTKIIKTIVEKYDGILTHESKDGTFSVYIMLRLEGQDLPDR